MKLPKIFKKLTYMFCVIGIAIGVVQCFRASFLQIWEHHEIGFLLVTFDISSTLLASSKKAEHTEYFVNLVSWKTELSVIHQNTQQYCRAQSA